LRQTAQQDGDLVRQRDVDRLTDRCYPNLVFEAHPGGDGVTRLYEDDGTSTGYRRGRSVEVGLTQRTTARRRRVLLEPSVGGYRG